MSNPLVAFALVAEEYEKSGDPIRGLKPLFAPILSGQAGQSFDPSQFARRFSESYGLSMTSFVANALAERLVDIGLLVSDSNRGVAKYAVADFDWAPHAVEETQIDHTLKLFTRWAKAKLESAKRAFPDEVLEEAMLLRLARPEFASIFMDEDQTKKNSRLKGLLGLGAIDPSAKDDVYLDYLVADFVLTAAESAPQVFTTISQIAYGSLVADAVAGLAVPGAATQPDPPLRAVFDGPLLLDLLDLNTVEHKTYAEGLLDIVKAAGLMTAVFDHSISEMRETIRSTLQAHQRNSAFGPLAERLRTKPGHALFATMVSDSLEARVRDLGFTILPSQLYEEARFKKFFPEERVDQVRNAIGDLHEHVEARIRDAKSIATVARLKGEKRYAESIFLAGTVFVTRNSVLARRVLKVLSVGRSEPDPRFTVVTDGQLAGVLWFVSGITGLELSRKRLVANCSSAVLPKPEVISRISKVLSGLDEKLSEEFAALMCDRRASLCPMRFTIGAVESIDENKSLEILESMKNVLAAPFEERAKFAEARISAQELEARQMVEEGKQVALILQTAIAEQETARDIERTAFDAQLAQLEFDLGVAASAIESTEKEARLRAQRMASRLVEAEQSLGVRELRAHRVIYVSLSVIAVAASLISILLPDFDHYAFRILLAVVYLASTGWVARKFDAFSRWLVSRMYISQRNYIAGLRDAHEYSSAPSLTDRA